MISFGPTICSPHSPDERVNIASVGKFWEYLKATLKKNIPAKKKESSGTLFFMCSPADAFLRPQELPTL